MSRNIVSRRLVPFAVAAVVLAAPVAAQADETVGIDINPGNVPTTAVGHDDISCDGLPDDSDSTQDGWVFVLPSDRGDKGAFVSVTATYTDLDGVTHVYTTDAEGGIVTSPGASATSKAYILTPAGWTLTAATAEVTGVGAGAKFNLTHTCPADSGDQSPSPSDGASPSGDASPSDDESTEPAEGVLPVTGSPMTPLIVTGAALALVGGALLLALRHRRATARG
ncbi:LPXTG-motif cell wall-anchored protein [Stackebrandtia albiflava]|uniref:LPXTG-motif cell wall-anchored protein n=1 Tax=Stackebrandtia albiflava TaxID=406432 RepID=A0A562ULD2_9ACTN|nr:LPXTG cell wall anchor domain-containing protein [Stackebrandtia albiflava]TWJ06424.1 LPXTG-motif cell wall-anchored protein [Stackebrandtia albiflava]